MATSPGLTGVYAGPQERRSTNQPIEPTTDILLGDTMGEMFAWYTACDVAFIGGSLVPLSGQNLIEACAVGAPVLIGPHTFNFAKAATAAVACGAARRLADAAALARAATQLLSDTAASAAMSRVGRQFAAVHRGAANDSV